MDTMESVTTNVRLIACPTLAYEHGKIDKYVQAGKTVSEHLRAIGWNPDALHARVFIDGEYIDQARWEYAVPKAGQSFVTRVIPGDGGKDMMRIVAMLGIVALAMFTAGVGIPLLGIAAGSLGANLAGAAISIAGSLATSGLIPTPRPRRALPRPVHDRGQVAA